MKNINESKIADEIENAIDIYYMEDNMDSVETISQLTGLGYDQVSTILDTSTQEDAMENLMSYNESKIITFDMFCERNYNTSTDILKEDKENIFDYLSKNFQKLTKEIKKLQENDQHIINELNNVVKINNLKR